MKTNTSLINLQMFKLSAYVSTAKFSVFTKRLQFYLDARDREVAYKEGKRTFSTAEMMNPLEELNAIRQDKANQAINALFRLNSDYKSETGVNIVGYLETMEQKEEVLEAIEDYINRISD